MRSGPRVGFYLPFLDERPTGVGVYIEEVCSRVLRLLPDAVVFTHEPRDLPHWLRGVEAHSCAPEPRLLPTRFIGPRRRLARLTWLATSAPSVMRRAGVDVFFSPVPEAMLLPGVPQCVVIHDLTALKFPDAYRRLHVMQTRWVLPRMLARVTRVIAVSQCTRRDLIEELGVPPGKIDVVYEGYAPEVFRPRADEEIAQVRARFAVAGRYLLYAGTFSRHKNLGSILRALAAVRASGHQLELVVAGRKDSGAFGEFERDVETLGLGGVVRITGYVTRDELATLMSGASAFVYPSRYEGFGLAPLEAMACGAPVLASDVASLPEVVGDGGVLVKGTDPAAWERALRSLLEGGAPLETTRQRALAQASKFSWDDAARRIAEVLRELAPQKV